MKNMKTGELLGILLIAAFMVLCGNSVIAVKAAAKVNPDIVYIDTFIKTFVDAIPGILILMGLAVVGVFCKKCIPIKLPAAAYIVTIGCILSIPGAPGSTGPISNFMNTLSGTIMKYVNHVNFMALTTPVLAYAGLSLAKDLDALKATGWKIVIVAMFVFFGTFIGSTVIADVVLKLLGQV